MCACAANNLWVCRYTFDSVETEFFYPSTDYISKCLNLTDVKDYLSGSRYKKPVYLVTGIKVGKGVTVRMETKTNIKGRLEVGVNNPAGANIQVGPKAAGELQDEPCYAFTESSDIVVGIQCLKLCHEKSSLFGQRQVKSGYVTSGAAFYGEGGKAPEGELTNFVAVAPEAGSHGTPGLVHHVEGDEIWMLPKDPEAGPSEPPTSA